MGDNLHTVSPKGPTAKSFSIFCPKMPLLIPYL